MSNSSVTLWTVAHQAPLSMGFPRQEYWSGLSFPCPTDLPSLGTESASPAMAGGFLTPEPPEKLYIGYPWLLALSYSYATNPFHPPSQS